MGGDNGNGKGKVTGEFERLAATLDATPPSPQRTAIWKALYQLDPDRVVQLTGPERLLCYDDRSAMQAILHGRVTEEQRQEIDKIFVDLLIDRIRAATELGWLAEDAFAVQGGMFTHVRAPLVRSAAEARHDEIGDAILDRMDDHWGDDPDRPPRRLKR